MTLQPILPATMFKIVLRMIFYMASVALSKTLRVPHIPPDPPLKQSGLPIRHRPHVKLKAGITGLSSEAQVAKAL